MTTEDLDVLVHSKGHFSKNWTKEDQKLYHHKWYMKHRKLKKSPLKVLDTEEDRQHRVETTKASEDNVDNYLKSHSNPLTDALYTARNETVSDTVKRIKKALSKKKSKSNIALAHSMDLPINEETLTLAHHGILGMRWGQLNGPPYPIGRNSNTSKTHSASEKAAAKKAGVKVGSSSGTFGGKKSIAQIYKTKQLNKKRSENLVKARAAKVDKAEHEKQRQAALASGDPKRIQSVMRESSNQEIQDALARVDLYQRVNAKVPPEPSAMDKIDKVMKNVDKVSNWYSTGTKVWNNFADTYNLVNRNNIEVDELPRFGQNNTNLKTGESKRQERARKQKEKYADNAIRKLDVEAYEKHPDYFTSNQIKEFANRMKDVDNIKSGKGTERDPNNDEVEELKEQIQKQKKDSN